MGHGHFNKCFQLNDPIQGHDKHGKPNGGEPALAILTSTCGYGESKIQTPTASGNIPKVTWNLEIQSHLSHPPYVIKTKQNQPNDKSNILEREIIEKML